MARPAAAVTSGMVANVPFAARRVKRGTIGTAACGTGCGKTRDEGHSWIGYKCAICGELRLHEAARRGDLENVRRLLKDSPELVFTKSDSGDTPLHWAALRGHKDVVALLLANRAKVNAKENSGVTPLHLAASEGHQDVAELLLANKADINAQDNDGYTPLYEAVRVGHKELEEFLRARGGLDPTEIHDAAAKGDLKKVRALLKLNPNLASDNNRPGRMTPLHEAARSGHKEVVQILLANGALVNASDGMGMTPLRFASANGHEEVAALLLPICPTPMTSSGARLRRASCCV